MEEEDTASLNTKTTFPQLFFVTAAFGGNTHTNMIFSWLCVLRLAFKKLFAWLFQGWD